MRLVDVGRHRIAVRGKVVDEAYAQHIPAAQAQRWPGDGAFIGPHEQPIAAHILIGILEAKRRAQFSPSRAAHLRFGQWRALGERH